MGDLLPFCRNLDLPVGEVLTDNGREFCGTEVSLGNRAVVAGKNAFPATRTLLAMLALEGARVRGDAIHAQAETAHRLLDRDGDDLFALETHRPAMLAEVTAVIADPPEPLACFETTDADHGRIETRAHRATHSVDCLFGSRAELAAPTLPGLASRLSRVEATRDGSPPDA